MDRSRCSLAVLLALAVACATSEPPPPPAASDSTRGAALFERHCALCHGIDGRGDGEAARWLFPPALDFGKTTFRLVRTDNGIPTDQDLLGVLERGMPGSSMPPFAWLPRHDLEALVQHVRALAIAAVTRDLLVAGVPRAAAAERARQRMTPGAVLATGDPTPATPGALALGERVYQERCASCHGPDGRGMRPQHAFTAGGEFAWPRDFTAGVLEGGAGYRALAWRILAGIPGSIMHSTQVSDPADLAALVAYVQTLIAPGAEDRLVQHRQQLLVRKVEHLPSDPGDDAWRTAQEMSFALAPLAWQPDAIVRGSVAALHDGERLALRLRWVDLTRDDAALAGSGVPDAAAVQLSAEPAPPLFGMGSKAQPTHIWQWKPFEITDVSALLEAAETPIPMRGLPDVPLHEPLATVSGAVPAEGIASARHFADRTTPIDVHASWHDDQWTVQLTGPLHSDAPGGLRLEPGGTAQIAFAIWNGSVRQHAADKSVTIWHELRLE